VILASMVGTTSAFVTRSARTVASQWPASK
jgi:hypothetical protein